MLRYLPIKKLCLIAAFFLLSVSLSATAQNAAPSKKIVMVVCPALTADDLNNPDHPALYTLARKGAAGLMNCAVAGRRTPEAALLTLALGEREPAETSDALAFNAEKKPAGRNSTAGVIYRRRTGLPLPSADNIVHIGIASLMRRGLNSRTLGALLASAFPPRRAVIVGNMDSRNTPQRTAALLVLNVQGIGQGDLALGQKSAESPYGLADANMEELSRYAVQTDASLFVIQLGDMARAEQARPSLSIPVYQAARKRALTRLDALLYLLMLRLSAHTDLLLVSPYPPAGPHLPHTWPRLTPVLGAGPDFPPGLLTSATTRTTGLISSVDAASSILHILGLPASPYMTGRPMQSAPLKSGAERMAAVLRLDFLSLLNARAVSIVMIPILLFCTLTAALSLAVYRAGKRRAARLLSTAFLFALNLPAALLLAPLLVPPTLLQYGLRIAAWAAGLTLAVLFLNRLCRLAPPLLCGLFCFLLIAGDLFTGQALLKGSLLSGYPLSGIRYYGIGNEYLGALLGMLVPGGFAWLDDCSGSSQAKKGIIFLWVLFALLCGLPFLGANAGSLPVLGATIAVGASLLYGQQKAKVRQAAAGAAGGLALAFLFGGLEAHFGGQNVSHAGQVLREAAAGRGSGYLVAISARKLAMEVRLLFSPYLLLGAAGAALLSLAAKKLLGSQKGGFFKDRPYASKSLPVIAAAGFTSLLFKDSGVVTAAFLTGTSLMVWLWYSLNASLQPHQA